MIKKRKFPPGLPPDVSKPLLDVADQVRVLEPWQTISDVELIGLRDDNTGELQIVSVLGTLGRVFAIVLYRREAGVRWIHHAALSDEAEDVQGFDMEGIDFLKVQWTPKKELRKPDLETLTAVQYKPKGKGPNWPRFELTEPGWSPWFFGPLEARLFSEQLKKVLRFLHLHQRVPDIFAGHPPGEVPVVPAGEEFSLKSEELQWLPLVPKPEPPQEPVKLSASEEANLKTFPMRDDLSFEFAGPLLPEVSFWDDLADRPCLGRAWILIDRHSRLIFRTELAHGPQPLSVTAKPVLVQGLLEAKVRPRAIHVSRRAHVEMLRETCQALGISLVLVERLHAADDALNHLAVHFRNRMR